MAFFPFEDCFPDLVRQAGRLCDRGEGVHDIMVPVCDVWMWAWCTRAPFSYCNGVTDFLVGCLIFIL